MTLRITLHRPPTFFKSPLSLPRQLCTACNNNKQHYQAEEQEEDEEEIFLKEVNSIIHTKPQHLWTQLLPHLQPHHVEKLLQTLHNPRLSLRFFNFLGLHHNFPLSIPSFCILINSLLKSHLFWPASSLLQTLIHLHNHLTPHHVYHHLSFSSPSPSSLTFDLLIQTYLQNKKPLDGTIVVELMLSNSLIPQVRTVTDLFNSLIAIRKFRLVLELFENLVHVGGIQPDVYMYTAVVRCLCEIKDVDRAREVVHWMEVNGCELNLVVYNVIIRALCKNGRVWESVEVKNSLP